MNQVFVLTEIILGNCTFFVNFRETPDMAILSEPIDGPEHNFKVSQLLRLLKTRRPVKVVKKEVTHDDEHQCAERYPAVSKLFDSMGHKTSRATEEEEIVSEEPQFCRRLWLEELRQIENRLAGELRKQLQLNAGEYLGNKIPASEIFDALAN